MITIKSLFEGIEQVNETVLVEKSDELWKLGTLADIKSQVSPELFTLHVFVNLIGNWKCDGWWFIFCEQVELVPYISETLKRFSLDTLKTKFENVISCFPKDTILLMMKNILIRLALCK